MRKLGSFGLALLVTLSAVVALGAASMRFTCDFAQVASHGRVNDCHRSPTEAPVEAPADGGDDALLLSMRQAGVNGS